MSKHIDDQSDEELKINREYDDDIQNDKPNESTSDSDDDNQKTEMIPLSIHIESNSCTSNNEKAIYFELVERQLKNVYPPSLRLSNDDIIRIVKRIDTSIFHPHECCIWKGAITNKNKNDGKNAYGSLFFDKKKHGVHRLIYANYVGSIPNERTTIKRICSNKIKCQNINHLLACTKQKIK